MPSVGGLGLEESCELALDIGKPAKRGRFYPDSGPAKGKTRTSCLSDLLLQLNIGYNGGISPKARLARVSMCLVESCGRGGGLCVLLLGFLSQAFI